MPGGHGRSAASPEGARETPPDLNWLLDTDVICAPAKLCADTDGSDAARRIESDTQDGPAFSEIENEGTDAGQAPKRDLFAELSEGMIALALLRPEPLKAGTKGGTKRAAAMTLRAAARGYRRYCRLRLS